MPRSGYSEGPWVPPPWHQQPRPPLPHPRQPRTTGDLSELLLEGLCPQLRRGRAAEFKEALELCEVLGPRIRFLFLQAKSLQLPAGTGHRCLSHFATERTRGKSDGYTQPSQSILDHMTEMGTHFRGYISDASEHRPPKFQAYNI